MASNKQTDTKKVVPELKVNNSAFHPVKRTAFDFSNSKRVARHMVREGNGLKIVEDGIVDHDAEIQAQSCNAGLQNIIRLQTMRYGTLENAIKRNADRQVFADVSKIPTSVAEQQEFVQKNSADVDALCAKLGISKDELLKATAESLSAKLQALNQANAQTATEGGAE